MPDSKPQGTDSWAPGWPIFSRGNLTLGNFQSNVGICTMWTRRDIVERIVPKDKYAVIGNLYTVQGINTMIKNVLANPLIRYIILFGDDRTGSGDALLKLMERGVSKNGRIPESNGFVDTSIPSESLEKFRSCVRVLDMRAHGSKASDSAGNALNSEINGLGRLPPFSEPVVLQEEKSTAKSLATGKVGFLIDDRSLSHAWLTLVDNVMKFGETNDTAYGMRQREILDSMVVLELGDSHDGGGESGEFLGLMDWLNLKHEDLEKYRKNFFGKDKPDGLSYTYGERLFGYGGEGGFDQIANAVEKLKSASYSRRGIAVTWDVCKDKDSDNPPCLTQITWRLQHGRLHQTAVFRSHDIFGAWPLNAYALRSLQKDFASELGVPSGDLVIVSNSAHVYEGDWEKAERILKENYSGRNLEFVPDKKGYFVVSLENVSGGEGTRKEIVVQHRLNDGRKSDYAFRGKTANSIYRMILNENLISKLDHAAYIGKELARAEECLRQGKEYHQDEA
jgi:thymidylate synthase